MQKAVRKEKPVAGKPASCSRSAQRRWNGCATQGDLIETDKPVDPDLEVTGLQKHMDGGCPVLFNNVKGKPNHRVLTNLFGDMKVINKMFGWKDDAERVRKLAYALSAIRSSRSRSRRDEAPCQEHVIENPKDVNEHVVPIRHTTYEPELTVGSGIRCVTGAGIRWRLRPRLQPHELPLGQCRHVPDLARLAHVAGGQQVLQVGRAGSDHHVLRRAAGLHAARRRGLRLRHSADGLRRDRHRRRGAGHADPPGQGAHRQRHGAGGLPSWCSKATSIRATAASRPRSRRTPASRAASISIRNGRATWARPTRRRPSTSPASPCASPRASRSSSRSASTRSTTTTSTPRCARRRSTSCATGCSPASCRTW